MDWLTEQWRRLRFWLHRDELQKELTEEMKLHRELRAEQLRREGKAPDEANWAARRRFGNATLAAEDSRANWGWRWLDELGQDLRYAIRTLRHSPVFTLFAAGALALGIGASTALFSVVYSVLMRPLQFDEPERLVTVWESPPRSTRRNVVAMSNFLAWRERSRSFASLSAFHQAPMNLLGGDEPVQLQGLTVTGEFFRVLRAAPALGRGLAPGEDGPNAPRLAVLSHGLWLRRFGGRADVVGQRISINAAHHEVIGVMPPGFSFPGYAAELFVPLRVSRNEGRNYTVVARLRDGVTLAAARAEMKSIAARTAAEKPDLNALWSAMVVPLHEQVVGQVKPILLVLFGAVGFLLLVACANVANLVLMRAAGQVREMSVRLALGAGRARLLRQLAVESLLLTFLGGALGVLSATWGVQWFVSALPASFPLPRMHEIRVDAPVLVFTTLIATAVGLFCGLSPALQSWRLDLTNSLNASSRTVAAPNRLQSFLVVSEVALAMLLVTGAGLALRSLIRLIDVEPGFRTEGVLTVRMLLLPVRDRAAHAILVSDILEQVRKLPGVLAAGSISFPPMTGNSGTWYWRADRPRPGAAEQTGGDVSIITPGYFSALSIPLQQGRDFEARDRLGTPKVAILNQTAARMLFGEEIAVGKRVGVSWNDAREVEIVGVAADIRHGQLQSKPDPCLFLPHAQQPFPFSSLVVRTTGDPRALATAVKEQIRRVDPDQGVSEVQTMAQLVADAIARPRLQATLLMLFGSVALTLAAIGIYGVLSYSVAQRRREIGIRMALGADRNAVLGAVLREGLGWSLLGLALGLGASLSLTRYLKNLLYEVEPTDPATLSAVGLLILLVATVACVVPAARAARVDPASALREE